MANSGKLDKDETFYNFYLGSINDSSPLSTEIVLYDARKNDLTIYRHIKIISSILFYSDVQCNPFFPPLTSVNIVTNFIYKKEEFFVGKFFKIDLIMNKFMVSFIYKDSIFFDVDNIPYDK